VTFDPAQGILWRQHRAHAEDREKEQKDAKDAERERAMKVGGLLKPAEIDQDDEL
jgi:exportin-1